MDFAWAAEAAGKNEGGGFWQLALVLAGIGFLGVFARWRKARTPKPETGREIRERDREPQRYRDAADNAVVELLETSRTLNAQVDTKIRILNRLVKEAEENAVRLEKLLAEAKGVEAPGRELEAPLAVEPAAPVSGRTELQDRLLRLRRDGKTLAEIARTTNLSITEVKFALESMAEGGGNG